MIPRTLPPIWKTNAPSKIIVDKELSDDRQTMGVAVDDIAGKTSGRSEAAVERIGELDDLAKSTDDMIQHAVTAGWAAGAIDSLKIFEKELSHWRFVILGAAGGEANHNTRARYSDAATWATHYSTVRMGISTFFIGLCWGIVSLKWDDYSWQLLIAAIAVWSLTGLFLVLFTVFLKDSASRQQEFRLEPAIKSEAKPGGFTEWFFRKRERRPFYGTQFPVWVFVGMSIGFALLLIAWAYHEPPVKITWSYECGKPLTGSLDTKGKLISNDDISNVSVQAAYDQHAVRVRYLVGSVGHMNKKILGKDCSDPSPSPVSPACICTPAPSPIINVFPCPCPSPATKVMDCPRCRPKAH